MNIGTRIIINSISRSVARRGLEVGGRVQKFIDSEVIRLSEPYTPMDTGYLKNSAPRLGTQIGSGKVVYQAPYAKRQYYEHRGRGMRGGKWFERMKLDRRDEILRGAQAIANQGGGE